MNTPLNLVDYSVTSNLLSQSLGLRQPPVAISFTDSIPKGVKTFSGRVPAGCRFWEEAAHTAFATTAADHNLCAIGVYTHNLQPSPDQQVDLLDALGVFKQLGYVSDQDLPLIPVLQSRFAYVIYSPLSDIPLPPDLVLLFVNAGQTLILSEATSQLESENPPALGRPACAVVPQVLNTGKAALSLGCCGARAYLDKFDNNTAVFAIPGARLQPYAQRIAALAQANSTLAEFHRIRRQQIAAGRTPTVKDSLVALGAG